MQISDQEKSGTGMDDTSITIEFLRARLLAERFVFKSARQRADELAGRVAELEEQLRIVSLQRRQAEKATADVLEILETYGANDISDSSNSSSDHESTPREQKERGSVFMKREDSINSREREGESEKFSGSELEHSQSSNGSLSWKGRSDPSGSLEKFKDSSIRRRSNFLSASSSSKQRTGKSCRQIKRKDHRSEGVDYGEDSSVKTDSLKDEGESGTGLEISSAYTGLQAEFVAGRDMERALERQAKLIDEYEDMEKAQREWEEKYRENNSIAMESCDPGNLSDITNERGEVKSRSPQAHQRVVDPPRDPESENNNPETFNGFCETRVIDSFSEIPQGDEKAPTQVLERLTSSSIHDKMEQKSSALVSKWGQWARNKEIPYKVSAEGSETSGKQIEPYALVPHQTTDQVGSLLDTLQRAKALLQKELTQVSVSTIGYGGAVKAIEPSFHDPGVASKVNIPGTCPGLFRLPTDFTPEAIRGNFPFSGSSSGIGSRTSFNGLFPDSRASLSSNDRFTDGHSSIENEHPSMPVDDRFLSNQFMNFASRTVPPIPSLEPHTNSIVPTSYTSYPESPSYPNSRQLSNGGYFPRLDSNTAFVVPPSDQYLFNNNISGSRLVYR